VETATRPAAERIPHRRNCAAVFPSLPTTPDRHIAAGHARADIDSTGNALRFVNSCRIDQSGFEPDGHVGVPMLPDAVSARAQVECDRGAADYVGRRRHGVQSGPAPEFSALTATTPKPTNPADSLLREQFAALMVRCAESHSTTASSRGPSRAEPPVRQGRVCPPNRPSNHRSARPACRHGDLFASILPRAAYVTQQGERSNDLAKSTIPLGVACSHQRLDSSDGCGDRPMP